jgi:hypothetical protein
VALLRTKPHPTQHSHGNVRPVSPSVPSAIRASGQGRVGVDPGVDPDTAGHRQDSTAAKYISGWGGQMGLLRSM